MKSETSLILAHHADVASLRQAFSEIIALISDISHACMYIILVNVAFTAVGIIFLNASCGNVSVKFAPALLSLDLPFANFIFVDEKQKFCMVNIWARKILLLKINIAIFYIHLLKFTYFSIQIVFDTEKIFFYHSQKKNK